VTATRGKLHFVGIPDEESWWRRSYMPGGYATGWRRTLAIAALVVLLVFFLVLLLIALVSAAF
jgi:hypothetical protein